MHSMLFGENAKRNYMYKFSRERDLSDKTFILSQDDDFKKELKLVLSIQCKDWLWSMSHCKYLDHALKIYISVNSVNRLYSLLVTSSIYNKLKGLPV